MKLGNKLLGENDIEAVLQKVDRLMREEAQTSAAQTLKVVYDLTKNIKIVMNGVHGFPTGSPCCIDCRISIQGDAS